MNSRQGAFTLILATGLLAPLLAQSRPSVTSADYARAESFLAPNLAGLVVGGAVVPNWLPDERFWYRNQTLTGTEIVVVDPARKTRTAFADCAAAAIDCTATPRQAADVVAAVPARAGAADAAAARSRPTTSRCPYLPMARALCSCATGTCGCAT